MRLNIFGKTILFLWQDHFWQDYLQQDYSFLWQDYLQQDYSLFYGKIIFGKTIYSKTILFVFKTDSLGTEGLNTKNNLAVKQYTALNGKS